MDAIPSVPIYSQLFSPRTALRTVEVALNPSAYNRTAAELPLKSQLSRNTSPSLKIKACVRAQNPGG